ncbi:hypothetical protein RRG08_062176 [Elysia crispata]|uniref:Uncharacterized protein n=1 Tax=Elysia crispata TaxID=231223 RepID=A0AAE1D6W3_9GAST|nr:hypothetical protein RRG08_062176 [Elysia crispata]
MSYSNRSNSHYLEQIHKTHWYVIDLYKKYSERYGQLLGSNAQERSHTHMVYCYVGIFSTIYFNKLLPALDNRFAVGLQKDRI